MLDQKNLDLIGYSDASWANSADRKSMSGYCFRLSTNSSLISWKTRKQPIVALSTCESEYIAMAFAMQECAFLQQLARDLRLFPVLHPCTLHVDNIGSIELSRNPVFHQRTKHLDIRFHYVRCTHCVLVILGKSLDILSSTFVSLLCNRTFS